jgi:arylsulfatase A-like enzyme
VIEKNIALTRGQEMNKLFICWILCIGGVLLVPVANAETSKPNIVYILVDNWGWGDISVQGSTVPTPRIDTLAREGTRFTNFNVENQCTPTRSAIHTGRLPIRSGTHRVPAPGDPQGMAPWEYTIAELLSDSGYATALYGKWHLGDVDGRLPNDQGYDEWWGIKESAFEASYTQTPQFDPDVFPVPYIWTGKKGEKSKKVKPFNEKTRATLDRDVLNLSVEYIREQEKTKRPFYMYIGFTHIHPPYIPHPDFTGKSKAGVYADIQLEVDYNVGKILDAIDSAGISENTIVILTGDNGAEEESHSHSVAGSGGSNGPWRGGLSTGYEGGLRTVGIVRWPGRITADRVTDGIFTSLDWYRTIAAVVGEEKRIPVDRPMDSIDLSSFLLGKTDKSEREHVVTYVDDQVFAVKWRSMKVHFVTADGTFSPIIKKTFPEVYDIKNDPDEKRELWSNEGFAHVWVMKPVSDILVTLGASMKKYPNIEPGQDFEGYE